MKSPQNLQTGSKQALKCRRFSIDILSEFYYMTLLKIGIEPLGDIEYYIFNA